MSDPALIIADPNSPRRNAIVQKCSGLAGLSVFGAATLSETYQLAEAHLPKRLVVAAEIADLRDFQSLSDMVDLMKADLLIFGEAGKARSRTNFFAIDGQASLDNLVAQMVAGFAPVRRVSSVVGRPPVAAQVRPISQRQSVVPPAPSKPVLGSRETAPRNMILIGASTGGIPALEDVLRDFPADCPPTLIVQHIRPGFAQGLIRRLDHVVVPQVLAANDGDLLQSGTIYVAANSDRHLGVVMRAGLRVQLIDRPAVSGHRPSVDVLFSQAANIADRIETRVALLTGMGADGARGMCALRQAGALTIAQDKESSVVWGMPRVAVEMGGASEVMALPRIGRALLRQRASLTKAAERI